jgi:hypothetical protein
MTAKFDDLNESNFGHSAQEQASKKMAKEVFNKGGLTPLIDPDWHRRTAWEISQEFRESPWGRREWNAYVKKKEMAPPSPDTGFFRERRHPDATFEGAGLTREFWRYAPGATEERIVTYRASLQSRPDLDANHYELRWTFANGDRGEIVVEPTELQVTRNGAEIVRIFRGPTGLYYRRDNRSSRLISEGEAQLEIDVYRRIARR